MSDQEKSFDELIEEFTSLVDSSANLQGNARRRNRDRRKQIESQVVKLADKVIKGGYDEEFVACRDVGHSWVVKHSDWESSVEYIRLSVCDRCGAERSDMFIYPSGTLVYRKYSHPDGYSMNEIPEDSEIRRIGGRSKRFWRAVTMHRDTLPKKSRSAKK